MMTRNEPDAMGNPPFAVWHQDHQGIQVASLREAAEHGELLIDEDLGSASLTYFEQQGPRPSRARS